MGKPAGRQCADSCVELLLAELECHYRRQQLQLPAAASDPAGEPVHPTATPGAAPAGAAAAAAAPSGGPPAAAAIEAVAFRVGRQLAERYTRDRSRCAWGR